eukprot:m.1032949 g.1032949  ORF g.1032949 m.1032949 type:complete len:1186 (+) comp24129_c0_seq8:123-3680(+)
MFRDLALERCLRSCARHIAHALIFTVALLSGTGGIHVDHGSSRNTTACPNTLGLWPIPESCQMQNAYSVSISNEVEVKLANGGDIPSELTFAIERFRAALAKGYKHITRGPIEPQFQDASGRNFDIMQDTLSLNNTASDARAVKQIILGSATYDSTSKHWKAMDSDESYSLAIAAPVTHVDAPELWGIIYALETLSQVFNAPSTTPSSPMVLEGAPLDIHDRPRFAWRGVMLDTANHYVPVPTILETIDAMAGNKMNVLHWHMVDSYSFPYESVTYPELSGHGAWHSTAVYSQAQIADVVDQARRRGIRVVPELEAPGHAYSMGLAYPNLTVNCSGAAVDTDIGPINIVPLNPASEFTFDVLKTLLAEFRALFPDAFLHLGGDEFQLACWNHSDSVRAFAAHKNMTLGELHGWFEARVMHMVEPSHRRPIVWEETFATLPHSILNSTVVEVWNDLSIMQKAMDQGFDTVLALGWYLDRQVPVDNQTSWFWQDTWQQMYNVPLPAVPRGTSATNTNRPGGNGRGRLLGGEANMWTEQVSALSIHARMWPRACAVAEKLWGSASNTADDGAAATRLAVHRCRMAARGRVPMGPIWADYCSADLATSPTRTPPGPRTPTSSEPSGRTMPVQMRERRSGGNTHVGAGRWMSPVTRSQSDYGMMAISAWLFGAVAFWAYINWVVVPREQRARNKSGQDQTRPAEHAVPAGEPLLTPEQGSVQQHATVHAQAGVPIKQRLQSLDVFRGLNIALMVFVDMVGADFPLIHHSPWNGIRLADFVMPFFDYMVGVSLAISLKRLEDVSGGQRKGRAYKAKAFRKATVRFFKIFIIGVLTQGGISCIEFNLSKIRIMGILQRVAVCYYAVALMEIFLPRATHAQPATASGGVLGQMAALFNRYRYHWITAALLFTTHTMIMYLVNVRAYDGEECGRGVLTPQCNAASYIDRHVFGVNHMYFPTNGGSEDGNDMTFQRMRACSGCYPGKCALPDGVTPPAWCSEAPFDPEGLVSSLNAIITTVIGVHCGHVIVLLQSASARLHQWTIFGALQLLVGMVLHFTVIPMNTDLYSISYTLVTGAAASLALAGLYWLVDVHKRGVRVWRPFMYFGMNAITMYLFAEGDIVDTFLQFFYVGNPDNSLNNILWPTGVFWGDDDSVLPARPTHNVYVLVWTLVYIAFWMVLAWYMHVRAIYVKI